MNRNGKNKILNDIRKAKTITQKNNTREDKNVKKPLYKIFMDENYTKNNKKFHLTKNPMLHQNKNAQILMDFRQANNFNFSFDLNLELFSYKILEAKYNSNPDLFDKINLDILVSRKKCHYLAKFNEMGYCTSILKEYIKRQYTLKEVYVRIPQYASYYKNYLLFFCKPCFSDYSINKKMVRHMEKVAQIFYNENYADEENEEKQEESQERKKMPKIFNKEVMKDIDNCESFTYVNSEAAMEQIQLINKKLKRNDNHLKENQTNKEKMVNNIFPIQLEQSTIIEDNHKITPIYEKEEFNQKLKNRKKIVYDLDKSNELLANNNNNNLKISQSNNSINSLLKEMDKENKGNLFLKNIKELNENPYTFRKINGIISPSNKMNMNIIKTKSIKNVNNNCILIQNGKTTNNINININNLTIGQKVISPNGSLNKIIKNLRELNNINNMNNDNILKKTITKFKYKDSNNNSLLNAKEKNAKKNLKNIKNHTESAPHGNKIQNIQIKTKKKDGLLTLPPQAMNIFPNFQNNYTKINPGTLTNQIKKTRNQSIFRLGHNAGSTTSIYKHKKLNYYNISKDHNKLGRFTIHGSEQINFKNIINNNIKNTGLLSGERTKNTSNSIKKPKKIFTSILQINKGNAQFFNLKNKLDSYKNSENGNILSPANTNKKQLIFERMKIKELKLKEKKLNLHKILNLIPSNKRSKSTSK